MEQYRNAEYKDMVWKEVARKLNVEGSGEELDQFRRELKRMIEEAYPHLDAESQDEFLRDQFVSGLKDSVLRLCVRQSRPHSFTEAFRTAVEQQAILEMNKKPSTSSIPPSKQPRLSAQCAEKAPRKIYTEDDLQQLLNDLEGESDDGMEFFESDNDEDDLCDERALSDVHDDSNNHFEEIIPHKSVPEENHPALIDIASLDFILPPTFRRTEYSDGKIIDTTAHFTMETQHNT
ncbi:hypothetical protein GE061_013360 [Apolygus lucorum]|uniref:MADF domain-containing protein n=1 Tax=Apolygus lucorum TaxID=248454 RepID=A0A8S9XQD7_APOLU|nr:hypothetical protein GE061_013360 [Apolygus lucorum]